MHSVPRAASLRTLFVAAVLAVAAAVSAAPAQADSCTVNIQGIVVTDNAGHGQPGACAPQVGRPEGTGTGRKVG
jgi:hypothetical protein